MCVCVCVSARLCVPVCLCVLACVVLFYANSEVLGDTVWRTAGGHSYRPLFFNAFRSLSHVIIRDFSRITKHTMCSQAMSRDREAPKVSKRFRFPLCPPRTSPSNNGGDLPPTRGSWEVDPDSHPCGGSRSPHERPIFTQPPTPCPQPKDGMNHADFRSAPMRSKALLNASDTRTYSSARQNKTTSSGHDRSTPSL